MCLEEEETLDYEVLMNLKRDASFALSNIAADRHHNVLDYLISTKIYADTVVPLFTDKHIPVSL